MEAHRKVVRVWVVKACVLLWVLAATLGAVACGTSDSPTDGNSTVAASPSSATKTYSNTEFDFAFDYDPAVIDGPENVTRPVPDTPGLLAMQFPGKGGGGGLALVVQEFDRRLEKADGAQYKDRLQSDMDALADRLDPDGVATPLPTLRRTVPGDSSRRSRSPAMLPSTGCASTSSSATRSSTSSVCRRPTPSGRPQNRASIS